MKHLTHTTLMAAAMLGLLSTSAFAQASAQTHQSSATTWLASANTNTGASSNGVVASFSADAPANPGGSPIPSGD